MACEITDLTGCVGDVVGSAVSSVWDSICQSFGDAATAMLQGFATAFAGSDKVNLTSAGVSSVYGISLGLASVVAALLLLWQVARTVWTHDGNAMAQGLIGVGKAALAFLMTLGVATVALEAADDITEFIVQKGFGSDAALGQKLGTLFAGDLSSAPTLLMLMALIGILITVVLWFELLMRAAAITILVATSPIAAAGQVNDSTKSWWSRMVSATIQLIILKPIIALVLTLGFSLSGQSKGIEQTLTGLLVLLLAVFAWPSVARFFTFASVAVGGGAGLGGLLGFASGRAAAMAGASSGGGSGGGSTSDFSQAAEARTTAAKSALGMGPGAGGSGSAGAAGAGADAAKQTALKAGMAKASTALAAAGPVGIAVAGAKAAQGAVNAVSGRMEQMAGHAGLSGASPYHQAAGSIPQQGQRQAQPGNNGARPNNQTITEQQSPPDPPNNPPGPSGASSIRPDERTDVAGHPQEQSPDRGVPATQSDEYSHPAHYEAETEVGYSAAEAPTRSADPQASADVATEPRSPSTDFARRQEAAPPPAAGPLATQPTPPSQSPSPAPEQARNDVMPESKEKDR